MAVTTRECQSMRLLARDGWTSGELRMTMHLCRVSTVRHHVLGQCSHTHDVPAVESWDGRNGTPRLTADDRGAEVDA